MPKKQTLAYLSVFIWIMLLVVPNTGCQFYKRSASQVKPLPPRTGKTVVLGFRPAMSQGEKAGVIRSPFSGSVFMAEPVPLDVADKMTVKLFDRLQGRESYELISPNKARGISESLISSDQGMSDIEIFQKIGKALSAKSVMIGYIYRWQERKGTDYSAERPASAAFDLYLIRSEDGAILWKGRFDKTQTPLSENVLDLGTFLKGKGKWMTVDSLADVGLSDLLDKSLLGGG